ncbi:hypothetical protein MKEN_00419400 [Mycena kentingensis (nom. inval.)]|nr:hypothetical protein MKEN_00419400 [Mycena kentingensis (nom. inval.)]
MTGILGVLLDAVQARPAWIVGGGLAASALLYRVFVFPALFSSIRNVPGPPNRNPLFGHWLDIIRGEVCVPMREWTKEYNSPVIRYYGLLGDERLLFLSPQALEQMFVKDWQDYPRPPFLRHILGLVAGYGLLTITGDEHKRLRRAMNPAFSISNLSEQTEMYYEPIEGLVEIFKNELKDKAGKVVEVYEWMGKLTLDIICDTAFGYRTDSLHNADNELAVAYHKVVALQSMRNIARLAALMGVPGFAALANSEWGFRNQWLFRLLPSGNEVVTLVDCMHRIREISTQMLREKTADLSISPDDRSTKKDIMSLLVRSRKAELDANSDAAEVMSDSAMVDQVLTFLSAGHETTASGLSWTLWLLAKDPESQRKLREEIMPVYRENPRPDYRTLKSLSWLDCVVNESLRVLPPVPMTVRVADKTAYVDGVLVPKGTIITCPIRVINTWKHVWGEDAEEFRPGRWLEPFPEAYNSTYSHFPFIAGPHVCIGRTMALSEMKAVLFALIANFEFAPAYEGQVAHPDAAITMKPRDNMPLRITPVQKY